MDSIFDALEAEWKKKDGKRRGIYWTARRNPMKPGLYEQIINRQMNHELESIPEDCKHQEKVDSAERHPGCWQPMRRSF